MTKFMLPTALLLAVAGLTQAEEKSVEQQIAEALMPLPDDLRPGATVIGYDAAGKKVVLREGTSNIMCTADGPEEGSGPFRSRWDARGDRHPMGLGLRRWGANKAG